MQPTVKFTHEMEQWLQHRACIYQLVKISHAASIMAKELTESDENLMHDRRREIAAALLLGNVW